MHNYAAICIAAEAPSAAVNSVSAIDDRDTRYFDDQYRIAPRKGPALRVLQCGNFAVGIRDELPVFDPRP